MNGLLSGLAVSDEQVAFNPTRAAGLQRLERFVARTGSHYASARNYDLGRDRRSNVSALSPWIRHRLVTEEDVLTRVLASHGLSQAEKFVQEVFWRTYFKGWLEHRPSVWAIYKSELTKSLQALDHDPSLQVTYHEAISGATGIDCFDHWASELIQTGYLHNHARMWMASIWIFTLRLPWELGADFFLRYLLDGDPASNTLSWRWVAGLHTKGKTYLARAENIKKYTEGRFCPTGLAKTAEPLIENVDHPKRPIAPCSTSPTGPYLLLLTEEDLSGADLMPHEPAGVVGLLATQGRSPQPIGKVAQEFASNAMRGMLTNAGEQPQTTEDWSIPILAAAQQIGVQSVATAYPPIGPVRERLDRAEPKLAEAGVTLHRLRREYDSIYWPHAKAGFFALKKKIPDLLADLNLLR
ncbi:DNA photolyase [Ruegeria sp. R13_0]|nr:DNA photolyase [Ruegeria sp. R13_0]